MEDYLTGRTFRISIKGTTPTKRRTEAEAPQASTAYNIYIHAYTQTTQSEDGNFDEQVANNEISTGRTRRDGKMGEEMEDQNQRKEDPSYSHMKKKKEPVIEGTYTRRDNHQLGGRRQILPT